MPALSLSSGREFAISYNESQSLEENGWIEHCEECSRRARVRIFHLADDSQEAEVLSRIPERIYDHTDKTFCPDNQEEL